MLLARPFLIIAVIGTASAPALVAQQKTPAPATTTKTGTAQISGVVVDSLNRRYLSGADVIVQGFQASIVTDSLGKFKVDSVPPGTYQIGVFHPLLDTLGITLATARFYVGRDSTSFVVLAVPS